MKFKVIESGDGEGVLLFPLPKAVISVLGWKTGDEVKIHIDSVYPDQIIVHKVGV